VGPWNRRKLVMRWHRAAALLAWMVCTAAACADLVGIPDRFYQASGTLPDGAPIGDGGVGVHLGRDGEVLLGDGDVPYFPFDGSCPACLDNGLCMLACNQNHPSSIGVDSTHVYWSNEGDPTAPFAGGAIMQMDKSGSNVSALVPSLNTGPRDLAVR